MKTVQQLKSQIYGQVEHSGFYKNIQAQVKSHVLDLLDKQSKTNKQKLNFEFEHPVLKKLRNYPLTSLCMDLIQQFLESFKFKHTLNVFKKQINRDLVINRTHLSKQFSIDLSGKDQSVLLSIVGQIVNGDVKIIEKQKMNNQKQDVLPPRRNNFMNEDIYNNSTTNNKNDAHKNNNNNKKTQESKKDDTFKKQDKSEQKQKQKPPKRYEIPDQNKIKQEKLKQEQLKKQQQLAKKKIQQEKQKQRLKQIQRQKQLQKQKQLERQKQLQKQKEQEAKKGKGKKNKKKQQEKPPQGATDLLADVVGKFNIPTKQKKSAEQEFKARKAFSQQKQPKKIVPQQSGQNKIRGVSMGKIANSSSGMGGIGSFMKFASFNNQTTSKNQQIDEQLDELQQSKDSTRKNPLYSSNQSGFDKSFYQDQSVDSMAIQDYQYIEKAKKMSKKK